jgi:hypothetical protein
LLGCEYADQREDEADGEEYGHDNFYRSMRPVKRGVDGKAITPR